MKQSSTNAPTTGRHKARPYTEASPFTIPTRPTQTKHPPNTDSPRTPASVIRRFFDIIVSLLGLILLSPLFALIALLIKRDSPGPVFYWGPRAGLGGAPFNILKFRTMTADPSGHDGPRITAAGDPRITRLGRALRDTKLNELPQLWNVLKGEMSLVGPRPEDPEIALGWPPDARREILSVRPGITSPASVLYRDEEKKLRPADLMGSYLQDILPSKLRLDRLYVRNRTLLTDLDVLLWTLVVLLPRVRDREVAAYRLLSGPLSRFVGLDFRWFMIDFPIALASAVLTGLVWRSIEPLDVGWGTAAVVALAIAAAFSLFNGLAGLNRVYWSKAPARDSLDLVAAAGLVTVAFIIANRLLLRPPLPTALLIVTGVFCTIGFVAVRYRGRLLTGFAGRWLSLRGGAVARVGERVLVAGAGDLGDFAVRLVQDGDLARFFSVAGFVDDDPHKRGMRIGGHRVLGGTADLPDLVRRHDAGLVLYAIANISPAERDRVLDLCRDTGVRVVLVPEMLAAVRAFFSVDNLRTPVSVHMDNDPPVSDWLDELEDLAASGEVEALLHRIALLKRELHAGED